MVNTDEITHLKCDLIAFSITTTTVMQQVVMAIYLQAGSGFPSRGAVLALDFRALPSG